MLAEIFCFEFMLAELVEQVNGQKEQSGKVLKKLDGIDERLTRLESARLPTCEQVSMITLKDHEEKMNDAVAVQTKWFTLLFSLSICNSVFQRRRIAELRNTQMKYRFIKASGFAPNAVQFLEDAYEEGQKDRINYIETTVSDYEKALKHKADSIARAEREKLERF